MLSCGCILGSGNEGCVRGDHGCSVLPLDKMQLPRPRGDIPGLPRSGEPWVFRGGRGVLQAACVPPAGRGAAIFAGQPRARAGRRGPTTRVWFICGARILCPQCVARWRSVPPARTGRGTFHESPAGGVKLSPPKSHRVSVSTAARFHFVANTGCRSRSLGLRHSGQGDDGYGDGPGRGQGRGPCPRPRCSRVSPGPFGDADEVKRRNIPARGGGGARPLRR